MLTFRTFRVPGVWLLGVGLTFHEKGTVSLYFGPFSCEWSRE